MVCRVAVDCTHFAEKLYLPMMRMEQNSYWEEKLTRQLPTGY